MTVQYTRKSTTMRRLRLYLALDILNPCITGLYYDIVSSRKGYWVLLEGNIVVGDYSLALKRLLLVFLYYGKTRKDTCIRRF